jgi:hypothetical protein
MQVIVIPIIRSRYGLEDIEATISFGVFRYISGVASRRKPHSLYNSRSATDIIEVRIRKNVVMPLTVFLVNPDESNTDTESTTSIIIVRYELNETSIFIPCLKVPRINPVESSELSTSWYRRKIPLKIMK